MSNEGLGAGRVGRAAEEREFQECMGFKRAKLYLGKIVEP